MYYYRCTLRSLQRLLDFLCSDSLSLILLLIYSSAHQLKHASRLEVHIVVRTKVRLICVVAKIYNIQVCVYTCARAIH
jgi:hypothetical protein